MRVLHLSADYPDPLAPAKTQAVRNLLTATPERTHRVYSLNRVGWRAGVHALDFDDDAGTGHRAIAYGAPPKGLFLAGFLARLGEWIAADLDRTGFRPDVVHAHKVSVEGLVAGPLARRLGVPLVLSSQGDSDLKIIGARRDLRGRWRAIWRQADMVLPFAPWTLTRMDALLGPREGDAALLPCPAGCDETQLSPRQVGPLFRTAFHLSSHRRKNAETLIRAVGRAAAGAPDIRLEIAGGGDPAAFARLDALARVAAPGRVRFVGHVPNDAMGGFLNGACAVALPSKRESFGMVFVEGLIAGAPCLIPKGWGIDGYLPDGEATLAVDPGDEAAVAAGLLRLAREEASFKDRLARLAAAGALAQFSRAAIAATYCDALDRACAAQAHGAA